MFGCFELKYKLCGSQKFTLGDSQEHLKGVKPVWRWLDGVLETLTGKEEREQDRFQQTYRLREQT